MKNSISHQFQNARMAPAKRAGAGPRSGLLLIATVVLSLLAPMLAAQINGTEKERPILTRADLAQETPKSANPYVSFLPVGVDPDFRYWDAVRRFVGEDRADEQRRLNRRGELTVETEDNNSQVTANGLGSFGPSPAATYTLIMGTTDAGPTTDDYFSVELNAGDILGVASDISGMRLSIIDPNGIERFGSTGSVSFIQPTDDLPMGAVETSNVAAEDGVHYIRVRPTDAGGNAYTLMAELFRAKTETTNTAQVIFVDFDGQTVNAPFWWGSGNNPAVLSPLSSFLAGWGLAGQEDAVIDSILASLDETLDSLRSTSPSTEYTLLNSRDHGDPGFIYDAVTPTVPANTSRLIIGGSISQLGISTIGIASSIDTGNFGLEDTAVVLLDLLSQPGAGPNSLNQFGLAGAATQTDLVGQGVGNIAAHEAGHFLGNWHTEQFNEISAIQDQGGNLAGTVGVGPDDNLGSADDIDVDFVEDALIANEGFTGIEHQAARAGFGMLGAFFADGFESGSTSAWSATSP